jgi:transposase-like protein
VLSADQQGCYTTLQWEAEPRIRFEQFHRTLPAAMKTLEDALDDSFGFAFPREHCKMPRMKNALERLRKEIRRRIKVAEQLPGEDTTLLLVTARLKRIHAKHAAALGAPTHRSDERRLNIPQPERRDAFTHKGLRYRTKP